MQKQGDTGG
jgi:hypothetical protein